MGNLTVNFSLVPMATVVPPPATVTLLTGETFEANAIVPLGETGATLTAAQLAALQNAQKVGGHRFDFFGKRDKLICGVGEKHRKPLKDARAIHDVVKAFPLKGVETLIPRSNRLWGVKFEDLSLDRAGYSRVVPKNKAVSAIRAARLEYLSRSDHLTIQKALVTFLQERDGAGGVNECKISCDLGYGGYSKRVIMDIAKAQALARDATLCFTRYDDLGSLHVNSGHPMVWLENGTKDSLYMRFTTEALTIGFMIMIGGTGLQTLNILCRVAMGILPFSNYWSIGIILLGFLICSSRMAMPFLLRSLPRDELMARNADASMMGSPTDPRMLAIMGRLHQKGFRNILTRDLGWDYLGNGKQLLK